MHILFLTHWFPPYNAIGAVRAFKIAQYFVAQGHKVTVLTTSHNSVKSDYIEDVTGIQVISEPFPALLRFVEGPLDGLIGWIRRVLKRAFYPDPFIMLRRNFIKRALVLNSTMKGEGYQLIVSTALPFSINVAAREISLILRLPWISDNRDIWANTPYRRSILWSKHFDLMYERKILASAAACITVGDRMTQEMKRRLGSTTVLTMMNGADCNEGHHNNHEYKSGSNQIFVYTGTLYKGRRNIDPLIAALSMRNQQSQLNFYGSELESVKFLKIKNPQIDIRDCGYLGKSEIKKVQNEADFLVLALGRDSFEKGVLTGKFFEYVESGKPIIAICDPDSDLADLIRKWSLGCASLDPIVILQFIESVVDNKKWAGKVPRQLTRQYQLDLVMPTLLKKFNIESAVKQLEN